MPSRYLATNIGHLVTAPGTGVIRGRAMANLEQIDDAAILVENGTIRWVGKRGDCPGPPADEIDLGGHAVVPALIDPHTHAVWAGDRLGDFATRARGGSYEEILIAGGGIRSTVRHTAAASHDELVALASPRIVTLMASGAATIEVKSGYGFTVEAEIASLEAIATLRKHSAARVIPTLLIHLPPKDPAERDHYLAEVTARLIPEVAQRGLASAVDIFIERESFGIADARRVFDAAGEHKLPIKAHVDQFHAIGGLELAVEYNALSVDHLEASGPAQISALASGNTVGVILPGVTLHLGIAAAPGRALIDAGAALAVGTDLNPGSSPLFSSQMALALAVRLNGLTPAEALNAGTANAAAALGLADCGRIAAGYRADFAVLTSGHWMDMVYQMGASPVARLFIAGTEVVR